MERDGFQQRGRGLRGGGKGRDGTGLRTRDIQVKRGKYRAKRNTLNAGEDVQGKLLAVIDARYAGLRNPGN